jgi:signal transduction histidine kinase
VNFYIHTNKYFRNNSLFSLVIKIMAHKKKHGIRRFIIIWMSGLILCFVALTTAFILSTNQLQFMISRIFMDSEALDNTDLLKSTILLEHREDLLWRTTKDAVHLKTREKQLSEAGILIDNLNKHASLRVEKEIVAMIKNKFDILKTTEMKMHLPNNPIINLQTDDLLKEMDTFKKIIKGQMEETKDASEKLNQFVDHLTQILILFVIIITLSGSFILVNRIVQPTFALSQTAEKYGHGDFEVRTRVFRDDELGILCERFNTMAEDITNLERDRLNFVASIAHDLKNPLIVVGGAARRIKKKCSLPDDQSKWLDNIIEQVGALENLIYDMMDSIQVETGNLCLQTTIFDLMPFIQRIHLAHSEAISTHDIVLNGVCPCAIEGDTRRLERAIGNLISNAIKYSPQNTTVTLKIEKREPYAVISIKDEGIGIAKEEIQNLFKPFKRLSRAQGMANGTGLGLYSAKMIVESHGGSIDIYSKPGNGTNIEILLPLAKI